MAVVNPDGSSIAAGGGGGGTEFDDGDAIDTTSQGTLLIGTTAVPGTARAIRVSDAGILPVDATGQGDVPITLDGESVVVTATDLDIRDLSYTQDSVLIADSGGTEINIAAFPAADGAALSNNVTVASFPMFYNGATWDRLRGDATDGLLVNLGGNNDVSVSGTVVVDATGQGDVPVTLDGEAVSTDASYAEGGTITNAIAIGGTNSGLGTFVIPDVEGLNIDNVSATREGLVVFAGNQVFDGSTWDRMRGDSTNGVLVNLGANNDVSVSNEVEVTLNGEVVGVSATDLDIRDLTSASDSVAAVQSGTWNIGTVTSISGTVTVDATGQGDVPVTLDGEAITANLGATDNAVLDNIDTNTSYIGEKLSKAYLNLTNTTLTTLISAAGASTYNYIKDIIVNNLDDSDATITISDSSGTLLKFRLPAHGGAQSMNFSGYGLKQDGANDTVDAQLSSAGGSPDVTITVTYRTGT